MNTRSTCLLPRRPWLGIALLGLLAAGCKPAPRDEILLRYCGPGYELYDEFRAEQGREFNRVFADEFAKLHPNHVLRVRYETITGTRYETKILVLSVAKMAPDVFILYGAQDAWNWGKRGIMLDLLPFIEQDRKAGKPDPLADIYPILLDDYTIVDDKGKKHLYALPGNCNTSVIYYNKDIFDEAGEHVPDATWTWDRFREAAVRLTIRDENDRAIRFGVIGAQTLWRSFLKQNGGALWSADKRTCLIDSQPAIETFTFLRDLAIKDHAAPTMSETQQQRGQEAFMAGRAAMFLGGRWYTAFFRRKKGWHWHIAPLPKRKCRAVLIDSMSWGVSKFTKYPRLAYEFVKYMTRPQAMRYLVGIGDALPIRNTAKARQILLSERNSENKPAKENQTYLDSFAYTFSEREFLNPRIDIDRQEEMINEEIERIWLGECDIETTLRRLKRKLEREAAFEE